MGAKTFASSPRSCDKIKTPLAGHLNFGNSGSRIRTCDQSLTLVPPLLMAWTISSPYSLELRGEALPLLEKRVLLSDSLYTFSVKQSLARDYPIGVSPNSLRFSIHLSMKSCNIFTGDCSTAELSRNVFLTNRTIVLKISRGVNPYTTDIPLRNPKS